MDCRLPGSSVHGISQAKTLEWVAMASSRGSSQPRGQTQVSCIAGGFFTTEPPGELLIKLSFNKLKDYYSVFIFIDWYGHDCQPDPVKV